MENKYYTPKIKEFYVGFQCEWQSKIRNETWNKQICDVDLIGIAYDAIEHSDEEEPYNEQFRVKVLDTQDIEECGFIHLGSGWYKREKCLTSAGTNFMTCKIRKWIKNEVDIHAIYDDGETQLIFRGDIKNINELKKILNMIGVSE